MASNVLNYTPRRGLENVSNNIMFAKSFGAAKDQSVVKKKALLDVKNTLHEKHLSSPSKLAGSTKTAFMQKDLMKVFGDKENANVSEKPIETKQTITLSEAIADLNLNHENAEPSCNCHDTCEDEFADIMFKHIRLSKPQVEDLALVWENPPILSVDDQRNILKNLEPLDESEMVDAPFRSFSEEDLEFDIMEDMGVYKVPPPFFYDQFDGDNGVGF